jgi:hypothetical protein
MAIHKLEKSSWQTYLDKVSKTLVGKQTEIEVDALDIGAQIEAEWIPLQGITYDPKNDLVEVLVEGLDHLIRDPGEIWVDHGPAGLTSMEIIGTDGVKQIIRFRDALLLPGPHPT